LVTIVVALAVPRYGLLTGIAAIMLACIVGLVASMRPRPRDSRASSA
jgi:hypothetical protein